MHDNNQQPKAFDPKMIIAIALIGVFYVAWQNYLTKKYPKKEPPITEVAKTTTEAAPTGTTTAPLASPTPTAERYIIQQQEKLFTYEDAKVSFKVSSLGMTITDFNSKVYFDRKGQPITLTPVKPGLFEMTWGVDKQTLPFEVSETEKGNFVGTAKVGQLTVQRRLKYNPENYSFTQEIKILNPQNVTGEFAFVSRDKVLKPESTSWLFPSYEHQDFLTFVGDKKETHNISRAKENVEGKVPAVSLYSLGTQYFTVGFLDQSDVLSDLTFGANLNDGTIQHFLTYKIPQTSEFLFKQKLFVGPKSSEALKASHDKFLELMDYGMLGFISKPMLASMKWFHSLFANWGWAIILLTLMVRAVVLPFNLMSYRSMKGMQKIQPLLADLRERYKDDPVALNREMMSVMKNNNANPLAGCLPILLQIPIFFALYRVIGSSVDLYQAPFGAWIQDLSLHDKFYVLPILMGVTMFIQQKLTPTTLDPVQAKILTFMPVVFCLFMLNLPAGLTLYMVVSAVFGIIQQKTFMALMKT